MAEESFKELLIRQSKVLNEGPVKQYQLATEKFNIEDDKLVRKHTFGKRDPHKMTRTLLLVGETGTGKTTIINAMVNFMLGVKNEEKIWFQITGKEDNDGKQSQSQTQAVTLYQIHIENHPFSLSIIDTPGCGDTESTKNDLGIGHKLLKMFRSKDGVDEIDAIVLVVKASQNRLTVFQKYIFNLVLSLFGKDVQSNVVAFFTHSDGMPPKDAVEALIDANVPCAKVKSKPIHFLFNNRQTDFDPDYEFAYDTAWNMTENSMTKFFAFLNSMQTKNLRMTAKVLSERKQLEACINNLIDKIEWINLTQIELEDIQKALQTNKDKLQNKTSFTYTVREPYKEKVPIDAAWWDFSKEATCCPVCVENCHHPGCWWVFDLSWCSVMKKNYCTVCTNKCHYTKHVKEAKRYVTRWKSVEKTDEDLKKLFDETSSFENKQRKLQEDLDAAIRDKLELIDKACKNIISLEEIALKKDSLLTLGRLDILIEHMEGTEGNEQKIAKLEEIQKRSEEVQAELSFFRAGLNMAVKAVSSAGKAMGSAGRVVYSAISNPRGSGV